MRILQIINSFNTGGAEKLLLETIPLYNECGISMDLYLLDSKEYPFLKELRSNTKCKIQTSGLSNIYNPLHIFRIRKHIKKYDIVHVHLFPSLYWVALAKIFFSLKIKLVYTEHNTSNKRRDKFFFKLIDRFLYKKYDRIVTIAEEVDFNLKNHLNENHGNISLIPNGINLDKIQNAPLLDKNEFVKKGDESIIIQVSSFTHQKDQKTLIRSLKSVSQPVQLLLVGDGELKEELISYSEQIGVSHLVSFLGIRMDVPSLLKTADIIVLSSNYEGLSLSCIEALASGRPFIASDAPGLSNIVKGAGELFSIGDDKKLALIIDKLLTDSQHYATVAQSCLKRADKFSVLEMIERHIILYKELNNGSNSS